MLKGKMVSVIDAKKGMKKNEAMKDGITNG